MASDGKVYSVGNNNYGQLGLGNTTTYTNPQEVTFFTDNNINITNISAGYSYTIFMGK